MFTIYKNLWNYRGFIISSVLREFQLKYRNSLLGGLWNLINPLVMILIYTLIFSQVMRTKLQGIDSTFAYSIHLCAGVLTWSFFSEMTIRSQNVFLEHANLIKKINFPRICLPMIVLMSSLLNFLIVFTLFLIFLLLTGNFPGWVVFTFIPVLIIQIIFSIGLGVSVGVLHVFFRDVGHLFNVFMQFWFWLTPIVYSIEVLPIEIQKWLYLNPMATLICSYQKIFVMGQFPNWFSLIPTCILSIILFIIGFWLFRKHVDEMVDEF